MIEIIGLLFTNDNTYQAKTGRLLEKPKLRVLLFYLPTHMEKWSLDSN